MQTDEQVRSADSVIRQAGLLGALRTGPFFDRFPAIYDNNGKQYDQYPPEDVDPATEEERVLIERTLLTRAPQMSVVYAVKGQS